MQQYIKGKIHHKHSESFNPEKEISTTHLEKLTSIDCTKCLVPFPIFPD